ncbi:uncharacterized protein LOC131935835 [Physella acuta]|uniref:uncharacterized protein LOC131935835 n=1 Tax=Physella acuta TaxID=109671 RepID=UPI0027DDA082|nr:uncharacterized protein LOC131935835 [Physella acuta]
MGNLEARLHAIVPLPIFHTAPRTRILILGLDGAGKTSLLYKAKQCENLNHISTLGFNVENVQPSKGVTFTVWDVGGQEKLRPFWKNYYENTDGLFFVVDSTDVKRLTEASEALDQILLAPQLHGVPLVVVANKQDLTGALTIGQVAEKLDLSKVNDRLWHLIGVSAKSGEGVFEMMKQMNRLVKTRGRG